MTIASQTSRVAYTGDGSTTAFAVPFLFQAQSDLVVVQTVAGAQTTKTLGTDYSVSGAGVASGGTVTFTAAPVVGAYIVIYRDPPVTQTTSYNNNDPFPAKSHENALDKLTMLIQRLYGKLSLSPSLNTGSASSNIIITDPVASEYLKWSADGTKIESTAIVTPAGSAAIATQSEASAGLLNDVLMTPLRSAQVMAAFDTRATAAATSLPAVTNYIRLAGYYTAGDFGSALYKRAAVAPSHAGYFQSADGAYWVLAEAEPKAAHFGVKGDNATGSSARTAETTAINNFFAYLGASPVQCGLLVGCTGNTFRVNGPLLLWPSTHVRSTGLSATIYSNYAGPIIAPYNSAAQRTNNVVLENIALDGESTSGATGIYLQNGSLWRLRNILITNCTTGVDIINSVAQVGLDAANYNVLEDVVVAGISTASSVGFVFEVNCNSNTLFACRASTCLYAVIDFGNDNKARDCQFEVVTNGIYCQNGTPAWATATAYVVGNYVLQGGNSYKCLVSHTSGTFATDLAAAKWVLLAAGGYFSHRFISDGNRFETVTTAHRFAAQAVNPTVINPFYSNVTTQITNSIVTAASLPRIFGDDGLAIGFKTWFSDIYILAATPTFSAIAAGASQDQLVTVSGLTVNDYVMAMGAATLVGGLSATTIPASGGFYIRLTNSSSGSITPGALTVNCLVMKKAA